MLDKISNNDSAGDGGAETNEQEVAMAVLLQAAQAAGE